jgi:hypothetical protein
MAIYNPLNWQNENALSSYPLTEAGDFQDFIVDAKFVQFDNFVPVLNYVQVNNTNIVFTITFDSGQLTTPPFLKSVYALGPAYRSLQIYTDSGDRYLGSITLGPGAASLWETSTGRKLLYDLPFAAQTVRSIPSADAVYTLDSNYGDVILGRSASDKTIFYNTTADSVVFDAVTHHTIDDPSVLNGLRKINLVSPVKNNINLASNDIIKVDVVNGASLTISLNAGAASNNSLIPSLAG